MIKRDETDIHTTRRAIIDPVDIQGFTLSVDCGFFQLFGLGQRDFFLLSRENEWAGLDADIARITREVIRLDTAPAIRQAMPALSPNAIFCPEENPA